MSEILQEISRTDELIQQHLFCCPTTGCRPHRTPSLLRIWYPGATDWSSDRPVQRARRLTLTGVGVEKLVPAKSAKTKSREDALQTTFSVFLDIILSSNFGDFEENGVFQPTGDYAHDPIADEMLRRSRIAQMS